MRLPRRLFLALPAVVLASCVNENFADADDFARRVGLAPIAFRGEPELRVWFEEYVFGDTTGYVVRPGEATRYQIYPSADTPEQRGPHVVRASRDTEAVLGLIADLRRIRVSRWSCGVAMDGGGFLIEGVSAQGRFGLSKQNHHLCTGPGIDIVDDALARVDALFEGVG